MDRCNTVCLLRFFISLSVFSLPFVICNYIDDANINLSECQMKSCSHQVDIQCILQQMHYPCLPGTTKDTFIDRNWPGKARNLTGVKIKSHKKWRAEFSWKPPYDSSIHSLKGFQLVVNIQTEYSLGTPYCFYANITNKNWTEYHNAYDTVFNFNCIESSKPLNIHVQVVSIPKPNANWQFVETELSLPHIDMDKPWDVNITWTYKKTRHGASIRVEFSPLYPEAEYHYICLARNENICQYSSNVRIPKNSETFEHLPFNSSYIIYIRPKTTTGTFMLSHLYKKIIHIPEAPVAAGSLVRNVETLPHHTNESIYQSEPTMSSVAELPYPDDTTLKLGALVSVSLVLIVAIIGTVIFFFHKGHNFKFCGVPEQPVRNHYCTSNHDDLNNITVTAVDQADIGYKVPITVIYFPENSLFNNCVKSFTSFINKIQNIESHVVELNSQKLQIEQAAGENVLLILSDLTYLQNKDVIPMICNHSSVHISAVVSFLPIMNIDLKEYQESYFIITENIQVDQEYRCQYREEDVQNLISTISQQHNSEETSLMTLNYEMPESQRLLANVLEFSRSMLSASKLPTAPYQQHPAEVVQSVIARNGYHCQQLQNHGSMQQSPTRTAYVQNGCPQRMLQSNGVAMSNGTVHFKRPNYQLDEKMTLDQKVKYTEDDDNDMDHESGFSSLSPEQVPFLKHGGSDFLPPESEFGSIEMLEQRMLELNQRSNSHW